MNIRNLLSENLKIAMSAAGVPAQFEPHVTPGRNPQFGDYQANGAMAAAKALGAKPRELAQKIVDLTALDAIAEKIEIAGPGFINIHLDHTWMAQQLTRIAMDERLGVARAQHPQTVVVDYSSPNLAKEMHVGHLRSTIIGDAVARVLQFVGDHVIRQNHVGDWGTQFGMLVAELELHLSEGEQAELALADLESFYQRSKKHFDEDAQFAATAREYVVKLQSGDEKTLALWQKFRAVSLAHNQRVYDRLNVKLGEQDVRGESAYNGDLAALVEELRSDKVAVEDQGATIVSLAEFSNKEGKPLGVIVQKNDGGYLYTTTDLAAIRHRTGTLGADRILYFIDARQSQHMQQVFSIAGKAGFIKNAASLEHHAFGMMLNKDGKPYKTREGGTVKLTELLDEAVEHAKDAIQTKDGALSDADIAFIAENVGIGAIKYADLSKTRTHDYIFDWGTMLSFEGNTGPYMQYAYARICSIFRKAALDMRAHTGTIALSSAQEKALALKLLQFTEVVEQVAAEAYPHVLCNYLYDLASLFMSFYEACPILKPDVPDATRSSRLQISRVTADTLALGLDLLGIKVMNKM